jgi:hypothetical protein
MQTLYLSRRNLLTLLAKLDAKDGGSLLKRDTVHPKYPCSDETLICPVEDEDYYYEREPGYSKHAPHKQMG